MARFEISLRVYGESVDPDDITRILGISPTMSYRRGDAIGLHSTKAGLCRQKGMWCITVKENDLGLLEQRLGEIVASIPLNRLVESSYTDITTDLFIGVFEVVDQSSIELGAGLLKSISQHDLNILIDLYT